MYLKHTSQKYLKIEIPKKYLNTYQDCQQPTIYLYWLYYWSIGYYHLFDLYVYGLWLL